MSALEAVVFDWGGTLTPWHNVDALEAWRAVARRVAPQRAEQVAAALFAAEREAWTRAETEQRSATTHAIVHAAHPGLADDVLEAAFDAYVEAWDPHTHTDPDVLPLLRALRERGLRIGVLSNTHWPRAWHERIFARDGVLDLLDGAVYTSEIPWTKPHPEAFHAVLQAVGVSDPARAVFVGDRPFDDIAGAQRVGMRAVLVPHSAVPAYAAEPDATVTRLAELLDLVDAWR